MVISISLRLLMTIQDMDSYLLHHKSEAFKKFKEFRAEVEKQLVKDIKVIRSDRGGEYLFVRLLII